MTPQEQLCEKMRVEQSAYCLWLTAQPPEEILHHAYEYSVREDIILATEEMNLTPAQVRALLKSPAEAIKDPATFKTGWVVLLLLLVGFFVLEPLGIPVSAIAAVGALILFVVAKRGHAINTGKVLRGAPWQIVIFSLGMYLVVYGLRNAGLTEYLSGVLNVLADNGLWAATLGTGFLTDGLCQCDWLRFGTENYPNW